MPLIESKDDVKGKKSVWICLKWGAWYRITECLLADGRAAHGEHMTIFSVW